MTSGAGTTTVTINGTTATNVVIVDDTTLTATVGYGDVGSLRVGDVMVSNDNGESTLTDAFTYVPSVYLAQGAAGIPGTVGPNLYRYNPLTDAIVTVAPLTKAGGGPLTMTGIAFAPDGTLYGTQSTEYGTTESSQLYTIDRRTGVGTAVGLLVDAATTQHDSIPGLTYTNGTLFGWTEDSDDPCTIDTSTGAVAVIGDSMNGSAGSGMAADAAGTIYVTLDGVNNFLYTVDPATGLTTDGPTMTGGTHSEMRALTFANGVLYGIDALDDGSPDSPSNLVTIDVTTGVITLVSVVAGGVDAIAAMAP